MGVFCPECAEAPMGALSRRILGGVSTARAGSNREMLSRFELKALDAMGATVEIEIDNDGKIDKTTVNYPIPLNRPEKKPSRDETLEINGRHLKCHVLVYEEENATVWDCDEVPGFLEKRKRAMSRRCSSISNPNEPTALPLQCMDDRRLCRSEPGRKPRKRGR